MVVSRQTRKTTVGRSAIRTQFERTWNQREMARLMVRIEPRDKPEWRNLRVAYKALEEVTQAGVKRCLDVYAKALQEYTRIVDMRGWCRHLTEGWFQAGRKVENEQCNKDEDKHLLRDNGPTCER